MGGEDIRVNIKRMCTRDVAREAPEAVVVAGDHLPPLVQGAGEGLACSFVMCVCACVRVCVCVCTVSVRRSVGSPWILSSTQTVYTHTYTYKYVYKIYARRSLGFSLTAPGGEVLTAVPSTYFGCALCRVHVSVDLRIHVYRYNVCV